MSLLEYKICSSNHSHMLKYRISNSFIDKRKIPILKKLKYKHLKKFKTKLSIAYCNIALERNIVSKHYQLNNFTNEDFIQSKRLFSFAVISDIHYADKNITRARDKSGRTKYYRDSLMKLSHAADVWINRKKELDFILNLGDIIDGNYTTVSSLCDLQTVMGIFDSLQKNINVYHLIGNHCLSIPRAMLRKHLNIKDDAAFYYSISLESNWKLIVLDTNDLGRGSEGLSQFVETKRFLKEHPPNLHLNMKPWNGGIASDQMKWLEKELSEAKNEGKKVIVTSHHPFGKQSSRPTHMAWNAKAMEKIIIESGIVPLVLSGHDHLGGYIQNHLTHFITMPCVLEAMPGTDSFGIFHVYNNKIQIEGFGNVKSRELNITHDILPYNKKSINELVVI